MRYLKIFEAYTVSEIKSTLEDILLELNDYGFISVVSMLRTSDTENIEINISLPFKEAGYRIFNNNIDLLYEVLKRIDDYIHSVGYNIFSKYYFPYTGTVNGNDLARLIHFGKLHMPPDYNNIGESTLEFCTLAYYKNK